MFELKACIFDPFFCVILYYTRIGGSHDTNLFDLIPSKSDYQIISSYVIHVKVGHEHEINKYIHDAYYYSGGILKVCGVCWSVVPVASA